MPEVIRVVRIDYDNLENGYAVTESELGIFGPKDKLTAHGNVFKFFETLEPVKMYVGNDSKVYPQFRLEVKYVR